MKYIALIKTYYPSLSKTEKKVADYILKEKGQIIYKTLTEISKNINVGEASIIRLVKKIGFKGFHDLKLEIAKEDNYEDNEQRDYESYIDQSEADMSKAIKNTKALLNKEELEKAINLIIESENVYFYGIGASALTAQEAKNRFLRIGIIGIDVTDPHFQMMYSASAIKKDIIIAFSLSGSTIDIIQSLQEAKNSNVKIIAITSYASSPVAKLADSIILTAQRESPLDGGSILGRISQMYVLDLLCTGYLLKNKQRADKTKKKIAQALITKSIN